MTRDSDFKQVVRARMAGAGESYTAARAWLEAEAERGLHLAGYDAARAEQERLVGRLFADGRIERVPAKRKVRAAVLLEVVSRFEAGRCWTAARAPVRSAIERQEIPAWEEYWLQGFLDGH